MRSDLRHGHRGNGWALIISPPNPKIWSRVVFPYCGNRPGVEGQQVARRMLTVGDGVLCSFEQSKHDIFYSQCAIDGEHVLREALCMSASP